MAIRKGIAFLVMVIASLLAGCGSEEPAPQPTPIPLQQVSFVNNLLSPGFALHFPTTWRYLVTENGIILSNDPGLLATLDDAAIPSGSIAVNVSLLTEKDVQAIGVRNSAGLLDAFVGSSSEDALVPQYRDSDVIKIAGRDGAQSFVSIAGSDSLLLALDLERNFVLGIVVAPQGELRLHTDTLNTIFASVKLLPVN